MAPRQVVNRVGNPLRADFDDADAQLGKAFGNAVIDERMKSAHYRELEFAKSGLVEEKIMRLYTAVRRVHANGQVELHRGVIHRIKIGIAQAPIRFQASQVHAARAMLLAELELIGDATHVKQRWYNHPTKSVRRLGDDIGHPAVVAAANRKIDLGAARRRKNKNRRIDHLNVDAELVHVL